MIHKIPDRVLESLDANNFGFLIELIGLCDDLGLEFRSLRHSPCPFGHFPDIVPLYPPNIHLYVFESYYNNKKNPATNKVHQYVVPCGKCAECTRKKQSEFGALALHQALQSGSFHMFTFTYGPAQCPIALSELTPEGSPRIVGYSRGDNGFSSGTGYFYNGIIPVVNDKYHNMAASLYREDVKLVLKDFRSRWKRLHTEPLEFKYAVFGEYGEQHGRPHYHGVFFGLSLKQAEFLRSLWDERFGFAHFGPISDNVSLDVIKKMSSYCSKYISKGVHSRWSFLEGFVEAPRRQSSLNFGDFTEGELDSLRSFMTGAICMMHTPESFPMISHPEFYLDVRLFQSMSPNILSLGF